MKRIPGPDHMVRRTHRALPAIALGLAAVPAVASVASAQTGGWEEDALERARAVHVETLPADCAIDGDVPAYPQAEAQHPLRIGEDGESRDALLVEFLCMLGAYNRLVVYVLVDEHGGAAPVLFPSPELEVRYVEGSEEAEVEAVSIVGTIERREVVNPQYDPEAGTLESLSLWRGLGDAYNVTRWVFTENGVEIVYFAVDPTYDLADDPIVLIGEE